MSRNGRAQKRSSVFPIDVYKRIARVRVKLKRAASVLSRHSEEKNSPFYRGLFFRRGIPDMERMLSHYASFMGSAEESGEA